MIHIIYIYLILNALITGFYINEAGDLSDYSLKEKMWLIFYWCLILCIGSILLSILLLVRRFMLLKKSINEYFQISASWKLKFAKELDNLDVNILERMNRITINKHNSNSLRDKIWRSVTDKVNKRNNYVYKDDSSED